ncbi:MAG: GntR family transcriptional regulator [Alphaproteobacteria bacterium]|nr:GntR family transcriptional regulator [Alphaproteobacteria bacterium]
MAGGTRSPLYLDVAAWLEGEIGRLGPNSLLPTEEQLAERFRVSRITVRGALDLLERGGLVSRLRGRGTTVNPPKITRRFAPLTSFEQDLASQGVAFVTRILSYEPVMPAPTAMRLCLGLPADSQVGCLSLVRLVDGRIVCHDRRYYPAWIAARLDPKRVEHRDASEVIEDLVGSPIVESDWDSEITPAPRDVAAALDVGPRTLVLANTYTWRIAGGTPIEAGTISYRVDRCKFHFAIGFNRRASPLAARPARAKRTRPSALGGAAGK